MTTITQLPPIVKTRLFEQCAATLNTKRISTLEASSLLWTRAEKIAPYVYLILAIGAFIAVGITSPLNTPLVALFAIIGLPLIADPFLKYCRQKIHDVKKMTNLCRSMIQIGKEIPDSPLKPLHAYHRRLVDYVTDLQSEERALRALADSLKGTQDVPAINAVRSKAHCVHEAVLMVKIDAAFIQAVLERPSFTKGINSLCNFNQPAYIWRVLAREFEDPHADDLALFNNGSIITTHQVAVSTITEIAAQFIAAIELDLEQ